MLIRAFSTVLLQGAGFYVTFAVSVAAVLQNGPALKRCTGTEITPMLTHPHQFHRRGNPAHLASITAGFTRIPQESRHPHSRAALYPACRPSSSQKLAHRTNLTCSTSATANAVSWGYLLTHPRRFSCAYAFYSFQCVLIFLSTQNYAT